MASQSQLKQCNHESLTYEPSPHASEAGYRGYTPEQLLTAAGKNKKTSQPESPLTFPAPLVLPDDDLAIDPRYPPQSVRSWARTEHRNRLNPTRRTLYVATPPKTNRETDFIRGWTGPSSPRNASHEEIQRIKGPLAGKMSRPATEDVIEYLAAFYHDMAVKKLPLDLTYAVWDSESKKEQKARQERHEPPPIAVNTADESIRISTRLGPGPGCLFLYQLCLNDLLDVAISVLPDDAYALLMLVDHDLFEDENDDFCCGRAYGGSRVAVVSSARYNPLLDTHQGVEVQHSWPASHCEKYVRDCCIDTPPISKKAKKDDTDLTTGSIQAAVKAYRVTRSSWTDPKYLSGSWLSRVARTASHELGHCFGMDHCVYYACIMQGTASMAEDIRQPPYLCPVDLVKLCKAIDLTDKDVEDRYRALQEYCGRLGTAFAGFEGWLSGRVEG